MHPNFEVSRIFVKEGVCASRRKEGDEGCLGYSRFKTDSSTAAFSGDGLATLS